MLGVEVRFERNHVCARMRLIFFSAALSVWSLSACVADPDFATGDKREALLELYREQGRLNAEQQAQKATTGIKHLAVRSDALNGDVLLSVDLENASVENVLTEILATVSIGYRASEVHFRDHVSARFSDMPIIPALNVLLQDTGVSAEMRDGLISLSFGREADALTSASGEPVDLSRQTLSREVVLKHLAAPDVVQLLNDLFAPSDETDGTEFSVGSIAELNAVFLSGPANVVTDALTVLARADRPVAHVIISALIVDIDTSSVETLGVTFSDLSDGSFSVASIIPNTTSGNVVATFNELAGNTAQLTATIKFLAAQNIAHVLSRPYIATRSTMPATIEIVDDQFARVDTSSDDSSIITTDSITAGISMNITPIVMADSSIRIDVAIEDSRFVATAGDIVIAKERSAASTSMIVKSGQTIVIGGLNSRYRITEKSGMPWLRKIPLLNLLTADQDALETQTELVVYLTPYVWMPGMDVPLPLQEKLTVSHPSLLSVERLGMD